METVAENIVENLEDIEKACWQKILNGSLRFKDAFHNPVISNVNEHGVNSRVVVLRRVEALKKSLFFHTDVRSGKWQDLKKENKLSCVFYDMPGRVQIRLAGTASLHTSDNIADEAWAKSSMSSRKIYLGEQGPSQKSTSATSGLPATFNTNDPSEQESLAGRKNFGIICMKANWMEWLWLNSRGHRRASFTYENDILKHYTWLVP